MDENLLASLILFFTGILWVTARVGMIPQTLLTDIWPALLLIAGLYYLYLYLRAR